jgi:opacity protein-like surface antigen
MNDDHVVRRSLPGVLSSLVLALCLSAVPAQAEMYVAGQVGYTVPHLQKLGSVQGTVQGLGTGNISDLDLHDSVMYGAKFGYYFESLKCKGFQFGLETEVFNTTPNVKQQNWTLDGFPLGVLPGLDLRVLTWAPVNLVMRYQIGAFEPYAGVGMGVFFSRFSMAGAGSSDATDVGLNTQLGLRYRVTNHFAVFCEWKLNYANLSHKDFLGAPGFDASADYLTHHLAMGVGYHF